MRPSFVATCTVALALIFGTAVFGRIATQPPRLPAPAATIDSNIHKIQHVIIITQENRSFDEYFGAYSPPPVSGQTVDGFPSPLPCIPDPTTGGCDRPFVNHVDREPDYPHFRPSAVADVDGGKMDGFIAAAVKAGTKEPAGAMGYHDGTDLPTYWSLAQNYVLQDHFFEAIASYSLPSHVSLFSAWAAHCRHMDPLDCQDGAVVTHGTNHPTPYAWTDITYLLYTHDVSWACYLDGTHSFVFWNVLPGFADVGEDGQLTNIQGLSNFFSAAQNGTLPAVSWIIPDWGDSEHPSSRLSRGQAFVASIVDAAMMSPQWNDTAIFLWWDDWGGFYDHVVPPTIDGLGLGLRVPALLVSPYAKAGYVDHQVLSSDSYLKFIEDDFLGGQRLDPATDGRPDSRSRVREAASGYGDLVNDFDFTQRPRRRLILSTHPMTTLRDGRAVSKTVMRRPR